MDVILPLDLAQFEGRQNWQESLRVIETETGKSVLEIADAAISRFSPDGHWLAFAKEEDGQVYVTQFPSGGARIAVSSAGGVDPRWRGDGQELFYVDHDLMVVSVQVRETAKEFRVLSRNPCSACNFRRMWDSMM